MFNFDFKFTDNTDKILQELERKERKFAEQAGMFLEAQAKKNITEFTYQGKNHPGYVDTGRARGSITHTYTVGEDEIIIYTGSNVEYFIWLEIGSGIYASDGKGRKSPWQWVDKDGVSHWTRGIRPSHALQRAITDNISTIQTMWIDIIKE
jgi:hypothetical protein